MSNTTYQNDNIFAKILRGELPCHKLYEDEMCLAIMDIMPRSNGHCLVIPKYHARNILDCDEDALAATILTVQKLARAVKQAFNADGVTIQQFNEAAGGQEVFHLHFHIIPRFLDVPLGKHTQTMEDNGVLAANSEKIRAALSA